VLTVSEHIKTLDPVEVAVVHFDETDRLSEYRTFHGVSDRVRLLADPDRRLYDVFAIGRGSWWRVWGPKTFLAYGRLMRRGSRYERHRGDSLQLGADIVIAGDRTVASAFQPAEPDARPSVDELAAAIEAARD
jgi:hypothetical protein